jgi:CheY-like chemotaxis protein
MDMKELKKLTQKLRVLYVEDEDKVRETTVVFLNRFFDDIVVATNGQEGLESFEKGVFDLVITDLKMPKLSGEELITKIKAYKPETIIITMSGISGNEGRENIGSDFIIVKPASIENIIGVLTEIVEQRMM